MGAGSSSEQRSPEQPEAGSAPLAEPESSGGGHSAEEAPGAAGDPVAESTTKLPQKNGQLSTVSGSAEQGEVSLQEGDLRGPEEEVVVSDVGQRESEDVNEKDSNKEMAANSAVVHDTTKDGQEEMPEIIEQIPSSENNFEELTQPAESQTNDVGFKKVFKFVGFKFTVKKDKSEKADAVNLLTVKKDEVEGSSGAGDHQESSAEAQEAAPKESELKQSTEKPEETVKSEPGNNEVTLKTKSDQAAEESKEGDETQEKEPSKSPDSPGSPTTNETASPFKKFFTQGWAGWRKKTSFRKPNEEELEATEKKKEKEPEKVDMEENGKTERSSEKPNASQQLPTQEEGESVKEARLSAEYEKIELPCEVPVTDMQGPSEEKPAPLATEVFDDKVEIVADVHMTTEEKTPEEPKAEVEAAVESVPPEKPVEASAELQEVEPTEEPVKTREVCVPGEVETQLTELSYEEKVPSKLPEGIVSEVEMLSAQERTKVQGSPLKKLFTSTGLKKLSGKKQKGKRGGGEGESGDHSQVPAESPDSADEQKGESSVSSPEEPEEITCLEKGIADAQADGEAEEGTTSDGEKKREGVTPWASFKKMVTPKKRVRRPSESDKEDEPDKVKSATLSSTESAASEMQEEVKGSGEEQKPEEPKRKVDTSVSWEALICVGSSKKRARKGSSSDDEGTPKTVGGDSHKTDEAGKEKEAGTDSLPANSQEADHGQGSSSPEQAGSPSEGEGVSTWESFKRLVTPRKKSKSKLEDKNEESITGAGVETSASELEPGKEESWVSIKKFIPGRRKKRSDGKQEQAAIEDTGPTEVNEDDSDVPAVVPLSEYDAVEREKIEAQQAQKSDEEVEQKEVVYVSEEHSKSVVHTVTVTMVDGARAVTNVEERSPSWISASVTEPLEQAEVEAEPSTETVLEREVPAEEVPSATPALPESKDAGDETVAREGPLTADAGTTAETTEAFSAEEVTEASGAEETTEMVSAVSQLTDSPDTTEEATPVQEVEGEVPDLEGLGRRTQEVLRAVAEKVKEESQLPDSSGLEDTTQAPQKVESTILEKVEGEEDDLTGLDEKKETSAVLKVHVQETKTENFIQGKVIAETTPESFEKAPQVPETVRCSDLVNTSSVETSAAVKSQIMMGQAVTPDSAEALTDSETNGSTPVADVPNAAQQDKIKEIHEDAEVVPHIQSELKEAEAIPAQKEMPPLPSSFQSQEESREQSKTEEDLEHTDKELSVETLPILSKTEVIPEADQFADEKTKAASFAEGPEVSADTEITISQKKITEITLEGKVSGTSEFQETVAPSDSFGLQSRTESVLAPVQIESEKTEAQPTQVSKEKLEQKTAATMSEELSKRSVQTVPVTVVDGANEVTGFEESSPSLVQEEAVVSTEIKVQSSDASLTLIAAATEEKVVGETIKMLETEAVTLESAEGHLAPEENPSDKDITAPAGEGAMGMGCLAESGPVIVSVSAEKSVCSDLEGDTATSPKGKVDEDSQQVVGQEVSVSITQEVDSKVENEIRGLESESSKLVQTIIETAVGQLARTEGASDSEAQTQATNQEARQETEKEESAHQPSAQAETQTTATKECSERAPHPDIPTDGSEVSEKVRTIEVEGASVNDQQQLEVVLPSQAKNDDASESSSEDNANDELGETAKSLLESKGTEEGDTVDDQEKQSSTLEETDASGDVSKESPDTNGPKLKQKDDVQEGEFPEGKVQSGSEKDARTPPQEEIHKLEKEPEKSELTKSSNMA